MWPSADIKNIPSKEERDQIQSEIIELESELERAQNLVCQLKAKIRERKAYIAPIRKLSFDVLSEIFIVCCKDTQSPQDPLTISAVSRWWREVILATPIAWSFISSVKIISARGLSMFFERSAPYLYHIGLVGSLRGSGKSTIYLHDRIKFIEEHTHRLNCVTYFHNIPRLLQIAYPNLTRLQAPNFSIPLKFLSHFNYPALRFLEVSALKASRPFPPVDLLVSGLLELIIGPDNINAWTVILQANALSLVSLYLPTPRIDTLEPSVNVYTVYMPHLTHLQIPTPFGLGDNRTLGAVGQWPVRLATPNLTRYFAYTDRIYPQLDVSQVDYLSCRHVPALSDYPNLKILQLQYVPIHAIETMIDGMMYSALVAPCLEVIEYVPYQDDLPDALPIDILKDKLIARKNITGLETRFSISSPVQRIGHSGLPKCGGAEYISCSS